MKKILLVSVVLFLCGIKGYGQLPVGCCPPVDWGYTLLVPDPSDCSRYYSCSNGVPILLLCPGGLHFNDRLKVCDWPDQAGCVDSFRASSIRPCEDKTYQIGNKKIETTVMRTNEPGFSWDIGMSVWLFNGKISHKGPSFSWSEKITIDIKCCRDKGPEVICTYEPC